MTTARSSWSVSLALVGGLVLLGVAAVLWIDVSSSSQLEVESDTRAGGVVWSPRIDVAQGEAYRGPWRMNRSDWQFVDDPTVAIGERGTVVVIWTDHVEKDLFARTYDPNGSPRRQTPVPVSQNPDTFSWLPRVALAPGRPDTMYVLWQEIIFSGGTHGGDALFTRSTDGGRTFSSPVNLSQSEAGDGKGRLSAEYWHNGSLDLAVGPGGTLYVTWTEYEGRLWMRRSTDQGLDFSPPVHVAGSEATPARGPSLAVDATGTVHVAWAVGEDPEADIHYTHSTDTWDSFATPRSVGTSTGHADAPSMAVDTSDTIHLAYGESPSGPLGAYRVLHTHSTDGGSTFASPATVARPDADTVASKHFPDLRASGAGTLHLLWERFRTTGGRPYSLGYTRTSTRATRFQPSIVVPGTDRPDDGFNGSQQGLLMRKLATNARGDIAVVNSTFDRGTSSHVWLYRGKVVDD